MKVAASRAPRSPLERNRWNPSLDSRSSIYDRIATHCEAQPNGCILWTGAVGQHGYGVYGSGVLVHRVAYEIVHGPIPHGHVVHHACEQKLCVAPSHLILLTRAEHNSVHGALRATA